MAKIFITHNDIKQMVNECITLINESLTQLDIDTVKNYLIKKYKVSTWKECVDAQKFGDCEKIVGEIWHKFYYMFDCPVDIDLKYSSIAQKLNNDGIDCGNHYVLKKDDKYYDFARGANCWNGVYLLTQKEDSSDKYDVVLTPEEVNCIKNKYIRLIKGEYPKGVTKNYLNQYGILDWDKFKESSWYKKWDKLIP